MVVVMMIVTVGGCCDDDRYVSHHSRLVCEVDYRQKFHLVVFLLHSRRVTTRNLSSILSPLSLTLSWICSIVQLSDREEMRVDVRHVWLGQISDHHIPLQDDSFTVGAL